MKPEEGIYAAIDFGSNSINLVIYRMNRSGMTLLGKQKAIPGILGYINNNVINDEGIQTAVKIIADMQKKALTMDARVFCFATASLRGIKNGQAVVDAVHDETGLILDIVSWEREAYYDYLAVEKLMNVKNALLVDIGGGSIELVWIKGGSLSHSASLPTGCLKLYRDYVHNEWPESTEVDHIEEAVNTYMDGVDWLTETGCDTLYTVGGTARAAAKLHREMFPSNSGSGNYVYPSADIDELLGELTEKGRRDVLISRLFPDRRLTVLPGLLALRAVILRTEVHRISLSSYGVREGYLIEKVWGQEGL